MAKSGRPPQDRQSMVQALVEAAMLGDVEAAKKYGITSQTMRNYRKLLKDDPTFFALFEKTANNLRTRPWAQDLDDALRQTISKMVQMVHAQSDHKPEALEAVTGAFKALSEMQLAREVLGDTSDSDETRAAEKAKAGAQQTRYGPS